MIKLAAKSRWRTVSVYLGLGVEAIDDHGLSVDEEAA